MSFLLSKALASIDKPAGFSEYSLGPTWQTNGVLTYAAPEDTVTQLATGLNFKTALTIADSTTKEHISYTWFKKLTPHWRVTCYITWHNRAPNTDANGDFLRFYFFTGEGTALFPTDPSTWPTIVNSVVNAQPGTAYFCTHGVGGIVTLLPFNNNGGVIQTSTNKLRLNAFNKSTQLDRFADSADLTPPLDFVFPQNVRCKWVMEKRDDILELTLTPDPSSSLLPTTWLVQDAKIAANYVGWMAFQASRYDVDVTDVSFVPIIIDIPTPEPPTDLMPIKVNTLVAGLTPVSVNNANVNSTYANRAASSNHLLRMTSNLSSNYNWTKQMDSGKKVFIDMNGYKMTGTQSYTGAGRGLCFYNGELSNVNSLEGFSQLRISDMILIDHQIGIISAVGPTATSTDIDCDRWTVQRGNFANDEYRYILYWIGAGTVDRIQRLKFSGMLHKAEIGNDTKNESTDFIAGKTEITNGTTDSVQLVFCKIYTITSKYIWHGKCGGATLRRNHFIASPASSQARYYARHGIDQRWIANYCDGVDIRATDYDAFIIRNKFLNGGELNICAGDFVPLSGRTEASPWPKGNLPNTVGGFPQAINATVAGNEGNVFIGFDDGVPNRRPMNTKVYDQRSGTIRVNSTTLNAVPQYNEYTFAQTPQSIRDMYEEPSAIADNQVGKGAP